jgi:hypothetical protein
MCKIFGGMNMRFRIVLVVCFLAISMESCRSRTESSGISSASPEENQTRFDNNLAGRRFENSEKNWDLEFVSNGVINRKSQDPSVIAYKSSYIGTSMRIEAELWRGSVFVLEFSPNKYQAIVYSEADFMNHPKTYRKSADSLRMTSVTSITRSLLNGNRYESADGKLAFEFRDDKLLDLSNDGSFGMDRKYSFNLVDALVVWERGTMGNGRPMKHSFQFSMDLNYIDYTSEYDPRSITN